MASVTRTLLLPLVLTLCICTGLVQGQMWHLRVTDSNNNSLPQAILSVRGSVENQSVIEHYKANDQGLIEFTAEDHPIQDKLDGLDSSKISLEGICYVPNTSFQLIDLATPPTGEEIAVNLPTPRMTPFTIQTEDGLRLPANSQICAFIAGWSVELAMEKLHSGQGLSLLPVNRIEAGRYEIGLPWTSQGIYLLIHNEEIVRYHVVGPFSGEGSNLEEKVIIIPATGTIKTILAFNQTRPSQALPKTSMQLDRVFPGNYRVKIMGIPEPDECSNYTLKLDRLSVGNYLTTYKTINTPSETFGLDQPEYFLKIVPMVLEGGKNLNESIKYDPFRYSDLQGNSNLWIYIANSDKTPASGKDYSLYVVHEKTHLPVNRGTIPTTGIVKVKEMKSGLAYQIRVQNGKSDYRQSLEVMADRAQATFYLTLPEIDMTDEKERDLIAVTQQKY